MQTKMVGLNISSFDFFFYLHRYQIILSRRTIHDKTQSYGTVIQIKLFKDIQHFLYKTILTELNSRHTCKNILKPVLGLIISATFPSILTTMKQLD